MYSSLAMGLHASDTLLYHLALKLWQTRYNWNCFFIVRKLLWRRISKDVWWMNAASSFAGCWSINGVQFFINELGFVSSWSKMKWGEIESASLMNGCTLLQLKMLFQAVWCERVCELCMYNLLAMGVYASGTVVHLGIISLFFMEPVNVLFY